MVDWSPPVPLPNPALCAAFAAAAAVGARRIAAAHRRGEPLGRGRVVALGAGLGLLAAVTLTPVEDLAAHHLLTVHLLQLLVLMGVVPPLLLLGLPAGPGRWPRPLALAGRIAVHPASALVAVNALFFGWHVPAVFEACTRDERLYALQLLTVLLGSIAFWWPIVEPRGDRPGAMPPLMKLGFILLATIPQTFAGLIFALDRHVIYRGYGGGRLGFDGLSDQEVAGACLALVSKLALFAAFSVVLWRFLSTEGADDDEASDDGGGPGDSDDEPAPVRPPAPSWLGLLEQPSRLADEPPVPQREPLRPARQPEPAAH